MLDGGTEVLLSLKVLNNIKGEAKKTQSISEQNTGEKIAVVSLAKLYKRSDYLGLLSGAQRGARFKYEY